MKFLFTCEAQLETETVRLLGTVWDSCFTVRCGMLSGSEGGKGVKSRMKVVGEV